MERTRKTKSVGAILTSDWHLREDPPTCFTQDWEKEQWNAVLFIKELQQQYQCPVIHAGDLFHHWKPSPWLLSRAIECLPATFYTIYGQHDLPQHNWELRNKSGIFVLEKANKLKVLSGYHYGQVIYTGANRIGLPDLDKVLVWHHLTYLQPPYPGASGGMAQGILKKYPQFDLIVTGDNHTSFTIEYEGRRLVNPGNLTRQTADQIDFHPRVALWHPEDNSITWVHLPIQDNAISREHIDIKEQRNERIDAFVSKLNNDYKAEMSFEDNLNQFFKINNTREPVKNIVFKAIDV